MAKTIELSVRSERRNQIIDVTDMVQKAVADSGVKDGIVHIFVPHTTAGITFNENYDPSVKSDILGFLERLIPQDSGFRHSEGNSDAHIKSSLIGTHQIVFISDGQLVFGTWQGICFCEFDGPRSRRLFLKIIPD